MLIYLINSRDEKLHQFSEYINFTRDARDIYRLTEIVR